jgi:hypothetical protein
VLVDISSHLHKTRVLPSASKPTPTKTSDHPGHFRIGFHPHASSVPLVPLLVGDYNSNTVTARVSSRKQVCQSPRGKIGKGVLRSMGASALMAEGC